MSVRNYIPQQDDSGVCKGVCFFWRDEYMNDLCENGFGVPWEALEVGYREYADRHGASWYKAVWWLMWALFYGFELEHVLYALSKYLVEKESSWGYSFDLPNDEE